jgi:hypothetical protein
MAKLTKLTIELVDGVGYRRIYNDGDGAAEYDFESVRAMARSLSREAVTLWDWIDSVAIIMKRPDEASLDTSDKCKGEEENDK